MTLSYAEVRLIVTIILVAFLVSEPSSKEEPASDVADEETDLAGENITLHITKICAIFIYTKNAMVTVASNPQPSDKKGWQ